MDVSATLGRTGQSRCPKSGYSKRSSHSCCSSRWQPVEYESKPRIASTAADGGRALCYAWVWEALLSSFPAPSTVVVRLMLIGWDMASCTCQNDVGVHDRRKPRR
eukprot:TRINITY_DN5233_c0_g1_i1.p2 TRINITY_DN5233_c0_g1~~TRINITY_DN5233_c0_g1_i1.p2  ORF type:complete len:105 (-),score=2.12 TRINITY_DN5233_c0_g1_i1:725-1039(-)